MKWKTKLVLNRDNMMYKLGVLSYKRKFCTLLIFGCLGFTTYTIDFTGYIKEWNEKISHFRSPRQIQADKKTFNNFEDNKYAMAQSAERLLGIPFVNIDTSNPYIPKQRIVHLDLKGAPPTLGFLKKFFLMIRNMGATGILLEYEDMFPYYGVLKPIRARNAYTSKDIGSILNYAEESNLMVIPLIQTFGHVEFALKHKEFEKLREVPASPQALCPNRNGTLEFVMEIVKQVMELHPNSDYLHIGCDEVFQMGECEICRSQLHENLFLNHIKKISTSIHQKYPNLQLIIWDDMLRHLSQQAMIEMKLGDLIEPMVWVYAEDIYHFVAPQIWEKYAIVFKTAWTASAFKGAFGETLYVPEARRHLENNLRWMEVMAQQGKLFKLGFNGIVLTGWQRYDHFAVLCEILPASIPSLALNLITVTNGFFNLSLKTKLLSSLSCPQGNSRNIQFINLDSDPHLWEKLGRCMFPGSPVFRLMYRVHMIETEVIEYVQITTRQKGWLTAYNVRRNYSLPLRVDELTGGLPRVYHSMISVAKSAVDSMLGIFDNYTIAEWIEQRLYPYIIELEKIQNDSVTLKSIQNWPSRPLSIMKDLKRFGIVL
nr:hexosaminidase D-like [Onthophagus taurus]